MTVAVVVHFRRARWHTMSLPARFSLVLAVTVGLAAILVADYQASYVKALDAMDRQRWTEAATLLREAIKEKPREDSVKIYVRAMITAPYLPHYQLGLALFHLNDCTGAVREWRESESQGVVTRSGKELDTLRQNRKACEDRLQPAVTGAAGKAEDAIRSGAEKSNEVRSLAGKPELSGVWQKIVDLGPLESQANQQLATARTRLDGGKSAMDVAEIDAARELAVTASATLDKVKQSGNAELKRLSAANTPPTTTPVTPTNSSSAEKAPGAAVNPPPAPAPQTPPQRAANPTPELLRAAARNYFDGQYGTAISLLKSANYDAGPAAVQSRLFHSAAAFALYVSSGQRDRALLQEAQAQAKDCRRLDPACAPDPEWFSPRFVQFFRSAQSR